MTDIDAILAERQTHYGDFVRNAHCSQDLKAAIRYRSDGNLPQLHLEALDMICLKISRIVTGDPNYADSWDDIAGYAKLVADRVRA